LTQPVGDDFRGAYEMTSANSPTYAHQH